MLRLVRRTVTDCGILQHLHQPSLDLRFEEATELCERVGRRRRSRWSRR